MGDQRSKLDGWDNVAQAVYMEAVYQYVTGAGRANVSRRELMSAAAHHPRPMKIVFVLVWAVRELSAFFRAARAWLDSRK